MISFHYTQGYPTSERELRQLKTVNSLTRPQPSLLLIDARDKEAQGVISA